MIYLFQSTNDEVEISALKSELEMAQKSLKSQTKRCRQLVEEYTRRMQEKEQQYQTERMLRDNQLANVIRALLMFEARLRQEQKLIRHQLEEKDFIIRRQKGDMQRLLNNQYCKHCNQFYNPALNLESFHSSSEYLGTDYNDCQSSNVESLDSSCETYATISEKDFDLKSRDVESGDETAKSETGKFFTKNKNSFNRRGKRIAHRKSVGTYFEVLKMRNDANYSSPQDESLPGKLDSLSSDEIVGSVKSFEDGNNDDTNECGTNLNSSSNMSVSDCNDTVIQKINDLEDAYDDNNEKGDGEGEDSDKTQKINESIPLFDGDGESNDKWYASAASDQEDEEQSRIYRNNPVLECMNQILLQNMNGVNSPPKTPNLDRKALKGKKVQFRDETTENVKYENQNNSKNCGAAEKDENLDNEQNYYETPVQKLPNFYETPQSLYSNDYEQILTNCNESNSAKPKLPNETSSKKIDDGYVSPSKDHHYIDMDSNMDEEDAEKKIVRKSKILRTPPALPPKPANLLSKHKLQILSMSKEKDDDSKCNDVGSLESEPDYCSISELNLPNKGVVLNKINVVSEINANNLNEMHQIEKSIILHKPKIDDSLQTYDPIDINECISNLVKKNIEKFNVQLAKQTVIKSENISDNSFGNNKPYKAKKQNTVDIPKLPQVSEIIIPEDCESRKDDRISQDNYIKNNTQISKTKSILNETTRKPIIMGSSVSTLITGFNNKQLISEIKSKQDAKMLSGYDSLQNFDKRPSAANVKAPSPSADDSSKFENFDLSQNFEEFKLDDCDIGEEYKLDLPDLVTEIKDEAVNDKCTKPASPNKIKVEDSNASAIVSPATVNSVELLKRKIEMKLNQEGQYKRNSRHSAEPTYEHFLECTGLSSKSILAQSNKYVKNTKSNNKSKDLVARSKLKFSANSKPENTVKYWTEPYI